MDTGPAPISFTEDEALYAGDPSGTMEPLVAYGTDGVAHVGTTCIIEPKTDCYVSWRPEDGMLRARLRALAVERRRFGYLRLNHKNLVRIRGYLNGERILLITEGMSGPGSDLTLPLRMPPV